MGCLTTSLQASSRAGLAICQSQIVFVPGPLSLTSGRGARQTANVSDRASRFRVLASSSGTGICISTVSVSRQSPKPVRLSVTATARDLPWRGLLQLRCAPGRRSGPRGRGSCTSARPECDHVRRSRGAGAARADGSGLPLRSWAIRLASCIPRHGQHRSYVVVPAKSGFR